MLSHTAEGIPGLSHLISNQARRESVTEPEFQEIVTRHTYQSGPQGILCQSQIILYRVTLGFSYTLQLTIFKITCVIINKDFVTNVLCPIGRKKVQQHRRSGSLVHNFAKQEGLVGSYLDETVLKNEKIPLLSGSIRIPSLLSPKF